MTAILRDGGRRLLAQAVEAETVLAAMKSRQLPDERDRLVRQGRGPERPAQTGIALVLPLHPASPTGVFGKPRLVAVQRVQLRDRSADTGGGERVHFTSAILPR